MATPNLAPRMTADDAAFLYLERKEMPLHIGSVSVFEAPLPFERFVAQIDSKLHLIPRYRQRVVPAPFNIGHPSWEDDPHFDIRNHIFQLTLDAPGDEAALQALSGRLFSQMMDRNKPLWEIFLIDGLAGGHSAMLCKVHHCMVDGVSGVGLMGIMMDTSRAMQPLVDKPQFAPGPLPDPAQLYFSALAHNFQHGLERMLTLQSEYLNLLQTLSSVQITKAIGDVAPLLAELAMPADRLPFNRPCSGERRITWSEFSFADARGIRGALGGTVNDVALTVLTGAVSRYVKMRGEPVARRFCRFMVPVNVRRDDQRGDLGNQVSALLVNVPLDVDDPADRLKQVNKRTEALKNAKLADMMRVITNMGGLAPAPLQALVMALPFVSLPAPVFNMVSTNVPGPQIPLYAAGQEMLNYFPHVPVGNDLGMGCAIQSYNQKITFGITSDVAAAPDAHHMRDFLFESFSELRQAAGLPEASRPMKPAPKKRKSAAAAGGQKPPAAVHVGQ
ncbi:MAG TPA: wax ester/triacylglycerol synthase family O-acyltransferase [Bryobacteraceae bacterium]|nr:wax ester/triacylglycerol synthase family O-acyltransferase [Bryobacteraceae bacterium]